MPVPNSPLVYVIVWKYSVGEATREDFEREYGPNGIWVKLFGRVAGYLGTELLRGPAGVYLTIDRWESRAAYDTFLSLHADEYNRIDQACAALTLDETLIGAFGGQEE